MEEKLLKQLGTNEMRCTKCGLIIPLTFKKGPEYTCPSFTMVDGKPLCYHDYHPHDFPSVTRRAK